MMIALTDLSVLADARLVWHCGQRRMLHRNWYLRAVIQGIMRVQLARQDCVILGGCSQAPGAAMGAVSTGSMV